MNKEVLNATIEKTKELMNASTCCEEVKSAAQLWLNAVGTDKEAEATKAYVAVLEENIVAIDDLIALANSKEGIQYFGEDTAKKIGEHAEKIKSDGAQYCDCPACSAVADILEKKNDLLN